MFFCTAHSVTQHPTFYAVQYLSIGQTPQNSPCPWAAEPIEMKFGMLSRGKHVLHGDVHCVTKTSTFLFLE